MFFIYSLSLIFHFFVSNSFLLCEVLCRQDGPVIVKLWFWIAPGMRNHFFDGHCASIVEVCLTHEILSPDVV